MGTRRFRIRRILTAAVIWGVLLAGLPTVIAEAACTSTQLVPTSPRWEINQGLGSYDPLTRGKDVLVKLYLTLPSCVSSTQTITITAASLTIAGAGAPVAVTPLNPNDTSSANLSSAKLSAPPALVNSPHDPKFLVAGSVFTSPLVSPAATGSPPTYPSYTATFRVNITYVRKVSSTQTDPPQQLQFSTTKIVDQQTKAVRILFQPIGDGSPTAPVQFADTDRTAVQNAVQTLLRVLPVPAGPAGSLSPTAPNRNGGIRSDINPGLLDVSGITGAFQPKTIIGSKPPVTATRFCATQTTFASLAPLLGTRLNAFNATQAPDDAADYIVGVYSENISWDSPYGCAIGMASAGGKVTIARAVSDKTGQVSMTGAVMAMELMHNLGGQPQPRSLTYHSSYVQSDNTDADGAYNIASALYISADKTAMNVDTSTSPWDNGVVVYEQADYAYGLCRFGGTTNTECTTQVPGGTLTGVAAIDDAYVAAGTAAAGGVKEGYHADHSATSCGLAVTEGGKCPVTTDDPNSNLRFIELQGDAVINGSVPSGKSYKTGLGIPFSSAYSHHDGQPNQSGLPDQFAFVLPGGLSAGATETRIVRVANPTDDPLTGFIIFSATKQAQPPSVTGITSDYGSPGHTTVMTKSVLPPKNPDGDIVFLADTTGSMTNALANVQTNATSIMTQIRSSQLQSEFAVANYKDFNCDPRGGYPELAYQLDHAMTSSTTDTKAAIDTWSTGPDDGFAGCDIPEAQLNALYQLATDSAVGFRTDPARPRSIAWFGDAPGHDPSGPGQPDSGITLDQAISALQAASIRVVAVPVNNGTGTDLDDPVNSRRQATDITEATHGAVKRAASSDEVAQAILDGLLSATVEPRNMTCDVSENLSLTVEPSRRVVKSGSESAFFTESVFVNEGASAGTYTCTLDFYVNNQPVDDPNFHQVITINVGSTQPNVQAKATTRNPNSVADFIYHCPNSAFFPVATAVPHTGDATEIAPGVFSLLFNTRIDATTVPGGNCTLTALVTDMFQRSDPNDANAVTSFTVARKKPRDVAIYTPTDGSIFGTRATIIATGGATDPEGGEVTFAWSLSGPGLAPPLSGTGPRYAFAPPAGQWAAGTYTLSLTGHDSDGDTPTSLTFKIDDSLVPQTYSFNGFFTPAKNWPAVNQVNAGQAFAAKWTFRDSSGQEVTTDGIFGARLDQVSCSTRAFIVNVFDWPVGATMVRYDAKGTQWVANVNIPVNIPAGVVKCYTWTLELKDGSLHQLFFQATK